MLLRILTILAGLIALVSVLACGEATPLSPAQATQEAVVEQTKTWESTRDKIHKGWDEEERIDGDHCLLADDDVHPAFPLAALIKGEIQHPETFDAVLGKDDQDETFPDLFIDALDGSDVRKFDIPMSEWDIENVKAGGKFTPLTNPAMIPYKYDGIWTDRPKHYAKLDFTTESDPNNPLSRYQYWTAHAFIDHWTCEVKLLDIVPNT